MHANPWREAPLQGRASLFAAAVLLGALYAGSTLVTPLYPLYQREFRLSDLTITLVYATYVVGNLGTLYALGRVFGGFTKVRYRGLTKNANRAFVSLALANLICREVDLRHRCV